MSIGSTSKLALRQLQGPGLVAGLDVGQRRDGCALVVARHEVRRVGRAREHRWLVIDAWVAPRGSRSSEAAPMIRDRLAIHKEPVHLVVDATGIGDAWVDHLVMCGVIPTLTAVVVRSASGLHWSLDQVGDREIPRVSVPRHPHATNETVSLLGALEAGLAIPPNGSHPAVRVASSVATTEFGRSLRAQLAGLAWMRGRPDHENGDHDDLAFALAMLIWASGSTPGATTAPSVAQVRSSARRQLSDTRPSYLALRDVSDSAEYLRRRGFIR